MPVKNTIMCQKLKLVRNGIYACVDRSANLFHFIVPYEVVFICFPPAVLNYLSDHP